MPRGFRGYGYLSQHVAAGHQAPPAEVWAGEMRADPIAVLRITENINKWEEDHEKTCPPGLVIAWARVQGLEPNPEQVQALLEERKAWRGHKALPEPGPQAYEVEISIVPPIGGAVEPPGGVYDTGTIATFTAIPAEGYKFDKWTGDYEGTDNPMNITVDSDKSITGRFKKATP